MTIPNQLQLQLTGDSAGSESSSETKSTIGELRTRIKYAQLSFTFTN